MCTQVIALLKVSNPYFWGIGEQKIDRVWLSHEEMFTGNAEVLAIHEFPTRKIKNH